MDDRERSQRDLSLEDIIEEVQGEHTAQGSGNSALDAMLRVRGAAQEPQEETIFPPQPPVYPEVPDFVPREEPVPPVDFAPRFDEPARMDDPEFYEPDDALEEDEYVPKKKKKAGKKHRSVSGKKIAAAAACAVIVLGGAAFGYTYAYTGIHFGVRAGAVKVGGMAVEDAQNAIDRKAESLLRGEAITLKIYDKEYEVDIDSVATGLNSEQSARDAYAYTHEGGALTRVGHALGALIRGHEVPLSVSVDETALDARLDEIAVEALTEPVDPSWTLEGDNLVIDAGKPGVEFDRNAVAEEVTERIRTMNFKAFEAKVSTRAPKAIDVEAIAAEAQAEPQNATVDKADGTTILPSVDGVKLDVAKAKEIIGDGSEQTYTIPIDRTPAEVTAEQLAEMLFRDTLASTSTNLNAGNKPRTNNVRLACEHINGTILNPGEEFSYNNVVGQRTAARGFKSAGAYSNGQVIDEVGGGVCQPSSTLYMAVLRADLEVTERRNHSFTVAYTPLGEDATVSWGGPDFRFKNNTKYPIKIVASQSGSSCNMKLIGTKTSDKTVSLKTEILSTLNYQTVEKTDASLAPGTRKTSQSGTTGYKTVTYKTITENGQSTTVTANNSNYQKRDKIILVGPAVVKPEPEPSKPAEITPPVTTPEQPAEEPAAGDGGNGDPEAQ